MNELILSEVIYFQSLPLTTLQDSNEKSFLYEFPYIRSYLEKGYHIKSSQQIPLEGKNGTIGLIATVVLQKSL